MVADNGVAIYKLSKDANLDRATIQRSVSGECLPSVTFVEKLCDDMRVTPTERCELMELPMICKIGENIYAGRKNIERIIEQIADYIFIKTVFQSQKNRPVL